MRTFKLALLLLLALVAPAAAQVPEAFSNYVLGLQPAAPLTGTATMWAFQGTARTATPNQILGVMTGDCTYGITIVCTKTNGTAFTPAATTPGGVSCSGTPTSNFATVNGVVTHC